MSKISEIEEFLSDKFQNAEIEIVDIEYIKENGKWILRVFIDKNGGVNMDDCEKASRQISAYLDEISALDDSYILEVSSPGLNRVLKKEKDFQKFVGFTVRLQSIIPIGNQRNFFGAIISFENNILTINDATNGIRHIEFSNIRKANIETSL
ncbi:MAG: ribosome maturation factor RimP [Elusimicrobiota bacterium]|jgi:ribosome maturation factor RimP|nr:ribosome maturation factor RimP [Elusimicrobiota bacterium]